MTDALKKVLGEASLSESAKAVIVEAWETKIQEAREEIAASLRDEFALKYEKDKDALVEAIDVMVREALEVSVKEMADAKKAAEAEKISTKKKLHETLDVVHAFVKDSLTKEVVEFRADREAIKANVLEFDKTVKETLTKELEDFHDDRRKLVEDRVALKVKAGKELAAAKKKMIGEMATICEAFIRKYLTEEMTQLRGELLEAKKKHFGTKVFEAFAAEYGSSFFNERTEVKKLLKVISAQEKKIEESTKESAKKDEMIAEGTNKYRIIEDRFARTKTMNELCGSLTGSKRKLMEELLEKVPTRKLNESFKSYLPSVISAETSTKSAIVESKSKLSEVTGDKSNLNSKAINESEEHDGKKALTGVMSSFRKMENYANTKGIV